MNRLEINAKDLESNIEKIKQRAGKSKIIAVVKGNGYGLGLKKYSKFLFIHGISNFAVSSVKEAIELSKVLPDGKILCLESSAVRKDLETLLDNKIVISIGDVEAARTLNELAKEKNVKAHIHIAVDTGFSRYGFKAKEKELILQTIKENSSIYVDGMFSHFSCAYYEKSDYTKLQFERFMDVKKFLEDNNININMYHIANSSAFLKYQSMYLDAVRIGSAFLGRVSVKNTIGLKKIGMLKSNVVSIKNIEKGTPIGYSNSEIAKKDMKLAIAPVGYSDGFHVQVKNDTFKFIDKIRILKNSFMDFFKDTRIYVCINEKKYPVIGKVGMNHITIDVTDSDVKIDDEVKMEVSPVLINSKIRREYK